MAPYFSIVIPLFNRERQIRRAVESCLAQDFQSFEIIVVDDGSVDGSAAAVEEFADPRLKLLRHGSNQGVSRARNTGVAAAAGEWIVLVDSDDELVPGALTVIHERSLGLPDDVGRMQFMGRRDSGELSPDPALADERWSYVRYLEMMERMYGRRQDATPVVRRTTFEQVRYNDNRSFEGLYHLDFFRRFDGWAFPDVVSLYHQDAENQLTRADAGRSIETAHDQWISTEALLARHGEALRRHAPRVHAELLNGMATLSFLDGRRLAGLRWAARAWANEPAALRTWVIVGAGLLGPGPLAWLKAARTRRQRDATAPAVGRGA